MRRKFHLVLWGVVARYHILPQPQWLIVVYLLFVCCLFSVNQSKVLWCRAAGIEQVVNGAMAILDGIVVMDRWDDSSSDYGKNPKLIPFWVVTPVVTNAG